MAFIIDEKKIYMQSFELDAKSQGGSGMETDASSLGAHFRLNESHTKLKSKRRCYAICM